MQLHSNLVAEILCFEGSTTLLLESLAKRELRVHVISQCEDWYNDIFVIKRVVKLYFDKPELPIFYCISHIEKEALTADEYTCLISGSIPIGKIFSPSKDEKTSIHKKNISVYKIVDHTISTALNICEGFIFSKKFQFYANNRYIGIIEEYFSNDTLQRL